MANTYNITLSDDAERGLKFTTKKYNDSAGSSLSKSQYLEQFSELTFQAEYHNYIQDLLASIKQKVIDAVNQADLQTLNKVKNDLGIVD
jgi:hypothetical protein